jgi:hypothetical protein
VRRSPAPRSAIVLALLACTGCGAAAMAPAAAPLTTTPSPRAGVPAVSLFTAPPSLTPSSPKATSSSLAISPLRATSPDPVQLFADPPTLGGCEMFPADDPWNENIEDAPVDPQSATYIASIDRGGDFLHPDFGSAADDGIPYSVVPGSQPLVPITFTEYGDQSNPGPYPIPLDAPVEQGSARHVLVLDSGTCTLYELYDATRSGDGWQAASGAVFPLDTNALRPNGWTSADAAGLPILPGLVTYAEVASGVIDHALRFTVNATQDGFVHPATHDAGSNDPSLPPMGLRLRLNPSFNLAPYHGEALVILLALQRYGMFVADNGSSWYITGAPDPRWDDSDLAQLKTVPGSAFQVVDTGPILH